MVMQYANTGTPLGLIPKLRKDFSPDFTVSPTGIFEYLLRNLRGMESVFDGVTTMAARSYPEVAVKVPDQYVTHEFVGDSAEKKRRFAAVDVTFLGDLSPKISTSKLSSSFQSELNSSQSEKNRDYRTLYKLYQQAFELYNSVTSKVKARANSAHYSATELFRRLRQGVYQKTGEDRPLYGYRANFRRISGNLDRVLKYLRDSRIGYSRDIRKLHLPVQDLSVKGLEALLQES